MKKNEEPEEYYGREESVGLEKYIFKPIENTYEWMFGWGHDIDSNIQVDEIKALIRYAAENGIDPPGTDPLDKKSTTIVLLKNAIQDLEICRAKPYKGKVEYLTAVKEIETEIIFHYTRLARETNEGDFNIHGRTLVDSSNSSRAMFTLVVFTAFLVALAIMEDSLVGFVKDDFFPIENSEKWIKGLSNHFFPHISPFIWGALGGCIYLAMRLYNIASYRAFDRSKYRGWFLRVMLASIIGAVTIHIYDPNAMAVDQISIASKTLAFLSGLSVKVVYGGFEKIIYTLVEKFNLDSFRTVKTDKSKVREFLAIKLSETEYSDDPAKKEALTALIKSLEKGS